MKSAAGLLLPPPAGAIPDVLATTTDGATFGTMPSHTAGDLLVMWAYRDGSTVGPGLAAGWTSAASGTGANTNSARVGWKVAASSGETGGTWTNASGLICYRIRGPSPAVGNLSALTYGTGTTITAPSITSLSVMDGTSIVICGFGHRSTNGVMTVAPSGMVNCAARNVTTTPACSIGGNYTPTGVVSWSASTANIAATSSGKCSISIEITGAV